MQIRHQPLSILSSKKKKRYFFTTTAKILLSILFVAFLIKVLLFLANWFTIVTTIESSSASEASSASATLSLQGDNHHQPNIMDTSSFSSTSADTATSTSVVYKPVPTTGDDKNVVLRYAAFLQNNSDGTQRPMTIAQWAQALSGAGTNHDDNNNNKNDHYNDLYAMEMAKNITELIKTAPFSAARFETKGTSLHSKHDKQFEFVLKQDTYLANFASMGDPSFFQEHFVIDTKNSNTLQTKCNSDVNNNNNNSNNDGPFCCVFSNLSGKSTLIAPHPSPNIIKATTTTTATTAAAADVTNFSAYGHLLTFCKYAPPIQIYQTWKQVGKTFVEQLQSSQTVWFSTAGTGVPWLHFRFDDRPKYYTYRPFAQET